jgi:preprotein translocase subunit SecE
MCSFAARSGWRRQAAGRRGGFEMAMNPFQFVQEVRQEVAKVVWPVWKEVWITTVMVLVMVALAAAFFTVADLVIGSGVRWVIGIG